MSLGSLESDEGISVPNVSSRLGRQKMRKREKCVKCVVPLGSLESEEEREKCGQCVVSLGSLESEEERKMYQIWRVA